MLSRLALSSGLCRKLAPSAMRCSSVFVRNYTWRTSLSIHDQHHFRRRYLSTMSAPMTETGEMDLTSMMERFYTQLDEVNSLEKAVNLIEVSSPSHGDWEFPVLCILTIRKIGTIRR